MTTENTQNTDPYSRLVRETVKESAHALMHDGTEQGPLPDGMLEAGIEAFRASYVEMKSLYLSRLDAIGAMIPFAPGGDGEDSPFDDHDFDDDNYDDDWDDDEDDENDEPASDVCPFCGRRMTPGSDMCSSCRRDREGYRD